MTPTPADRNQPEPHGAATVPGRWRDERGSVAVETAIGVPMLILVVLVAAAAFVTARADLQVHAAASAAARAASLARTTTAAATDATRTVQANLADRCAALAIDIDTSGFRRGGQVRVTVSCTVTTRGLTGLGLPGRTTLTATATSPIDVYRHITHGIAQAKDNHHA